MNVHTFVGVETERIISMLNEYEKDFIIKTSEPYVGMLYYNLNPFIKIEFKRIIETGKIFGESEDDKIALAKMIMTNVWIRLKSRQNPEVYRKAV